MENSDSLLLHVVSTFDHMVAEGLAAIHMRATDRGRSVRIVPEKQADALAVELYAWPTGIDLIARDGDLSYGVFEFGLDEAEKLIRVLEKIFLGECRGTYRQLGRWRWADSLDVGEHVYSAQSPIIAVLVGRRSKQYPAY
jgi:hypothetical protein